MRSAIILLGVALLAAVSASGQPAKTKWKLDSTVPRSEIRTLDPASIDPSGLPLDPVSALHTTGTPPAVDMASWRLVVDGKGVLTGVSFGYEELNGMPSQADRAILICPNFFADYAEWDGVLLEDLLAKAVLKPTWTRIIFFAIDGYSETFSREEIESHRLLLATKVNGEVLPAAHGYPVRLVAEDLVGGRWLKWVREIRVE
jgi:DMSO/TMAO reductase YedYZ molybdopterin-dependent catalytic subunit